MSNIERGPWDDRDPSPVRGRLAPFDTIDPTAWQDQPVPERRWLIPGLVVRGSVTMLNGDGGIGKSLLMQQLMTAAATSQPWLGIELPADPICSLGFFCEDDRDELHFRQSKMNDYYGVDFRDLGPMTLVSRVGLDNELMNFDRRTDTGKETPLYNQLQTKIRERGIQLIIIDTVADTFNGNENIRPQVRRFVNGLRRLAMINDGGVILTAHPSLMGLNSGSGMSGSTAWNNSVRGRLYLTRQKLQNDDDEEDLDARVLKIMKSNYSKSGDKLRLRWKDHVFVLDQESASPSDTVDRLEITNAVLAGLRWHINNGTLCAQDPKAPNGMANLVRSLPSCRKWNWSAVVQAQNKLLADGRIQKVEMGPPSRRRVYVRPADMRLPGEVGDGKAEE